METEGGFQIGESVGSGVRLGGMAEFLAVDSTTVRRIPDGMDFTCAAAFGTAYLTAYVALVRCGGLLPGQWILVHGASGGVGLAAVDLARALGGRVIATSACPNKLRIVAASYHPEQTLVTGGRFRDAVSEMSGGGVDLVYDPVGGDIFDESTRCLRFGGKLLVIGFTSGRISQVAANIPLIKGFSVVGVRAGEYGRQFPEQGRENLQAIWSMAAEGQLRPRVHAVFPLSRWREAFRMLLERAHVGKLVLRPDEEFCG